MKKQIDAAVLKKFIDELVQSIVFPWNTAIDKGHRRAAKIIRAEIVRMQKESHG